MMPIQIKKVNGVWSYNGVRVKTKYLKKLRKHKMKIKVKKEEEIHIEKVISKKLQKNSLVN